MNKVLKHIILVTIILFFMMDLSAQCAMCKAVVESGLDGNETVVIGNGINKGIYFLIGIPYILLSILGLIIYKNRKAINL